MELEALLSKSNTNWTVSKRPLTGPQGELSPAFGIFRDDNLRCLGTVKSKYTITQNHEVAALMVEAADTLNIKATRGGYLGHGERVYYQFELPQVQIGGSNNLRYLTGLTAHDGLTKIGFGATNVVVICANTFYSALQDCESVKHTPNHKGKLTQIINSLKLSLTAEEMLVEKLVKLSRTTIPSKIEDDFLISILGGTVDTSRTKNRIEGLRSAMIPEFNTHGETAYGLFNAVTRFTNHVVTYKDVDTKRKALMFGTAARINENALKLIESTYA
jgi:phage/plasmid-like protein (TIGR03299 family)